MINTQQRLDRYQELLMISDEQARAFFNENKKVDKRFASVVQLYAVFVEAFIIMMG